MRGRELKPQPIKIELGGKLRELKFDLNAAAYLEEEFGDMTEIGRIMLNDPKVKHIRHIIFALLQHEEEEHTIKQVNSWVDMNNFQEVAGACTKAILNGLPPGEADAAEQMIKKIESGEVDPKNLETLQEKPSTGECSTTSPEPSSE
jgi:hypothetical protein